MSGGYQGFILAAYGFSALAIIGLGVWIYLDARNQKRALADLDARGVRRRSATKPVNSSEGARTI